MKIGIHLNPYNERFARLGDKKFDFIRSARFDAIDYNIPDTGVELYRMSEGELEARMSEEKEKAKEAEIVISQIHGPWKYPPMDDTVQNRSERLAAMKRSILATHFLGCKYWVVHPIMPYGIDDLALGKAKETFRLNYEFFSELLKYAAELDVTICLENMPFTGFSMAKPERVLEFVKLFDDEHMKLCLDTGHVAVFPDLALEEEVLRLGEYVKAIHVHDNCGDIDRHLYPKEGIINWEGFVRALNSIRFAGVFSLETSPSQSLSDEEYLSECKRLYAIAEEITSAEG